MTIGPDVAADPRAVEREQDRGRRDGPPPWRRRLARGSLGTFRYVRSIAVVVVIWTLVALWIDNRVLLPAPNRVVGSLVDLLTDGDFLQEYRTSGTRLLVGFAAAGLVAILLGVAMGLSKIVHDVADPVVEMLRPISALAWIPLWLAVFGISKTLPYFVIFYVALFPFLLNATAGIRGVDPVLVRVARTMGIEGNTLVRRVVLPDALPSVLTGARLAMGGAWMALIASELIGAPNGLGFRILFYGSTFQTSHMLAVIAVIAVSGYLTDLGLRTLQRRWTPWEAPS